MIANIIADIKLMLGNSADNYSDEQISHAYKRAVMEIETYCRRTIDIELSMVAEEIAVIKLNRMNTEGLSNQSYSGVSEGYIDGYPDHIKRILNSRRKIKIL
jgi:hypothetical protein